MILSGNEILRQLEFGNILIQPFNPKYINPASVDLTLGETVSVFEKFATFPSSGSILDGREVRYRSDNGGHIHDTKTEPSLVSWKINPTLGWVLNPGVCYLMHTHQTVFAKNYTPILTGKSSIGRLFIQVQMADYGDPGFDGNYTLQVTSQFPVRVYPGMRICQIRFHTLEGEVPSYQKGGHYQGVYAQGPVGSRAHISAFR